MTQEDKELLIQDLCARLPYGVICTDSNNTGELTQISIPHDICVLEYGDSAVCSIADCRPYLFPLSSMTEEQKEEYCQLQQKIIYNSKGVVNDDITEYINWLNKNHFDYQGLIEKSLAIDATVKNIY